MTTEDGTKAPTVRLVPLLVANLTMVSLLINLFSLTLTLALALTLS